MKKLALPFAATALLLGAGLAVLVGRSLDTVEREVASRHKLLAERVFDEMEQALSQLVAEEDARPFAQYRFLQVPEGALPGSAVLTRSPLSLPPERPGVLGWFQVEPDGTVTTPMLPREGELALSAWVDDGGARDRAAAVLALAASVPKPAPIEAPVPPADGDALVEQQDGASFAEREELGRRGAYRTAAPAKSPIATKANTPVAEKKAEVDRSYEDIATSLNKGADSRSQRKQRVEKLDDSNAYAVQTAEPNLPEVPFRDEPVAAADPAKTGAKERGNEETRAEEALAARALEQREAESQRAEAAGASGLERAPAATSKDLAFEDALAEAEVEPADDEAEAAPQKQKGRAGRAKPAAAGGTASAQPTTADSAAREAPPAASSPGSAPMVVPDVADVDANAWVGRQDEQGGGTVDAALGEGSAAAAPPSQAQAHDAVTSSAPPPRSPAEAHNLGGQGWAPDPGVAIAEVLSGPSPKPPAAAEPPLGTFSIAVEPLRGLRVDARHLVLWRPVQAGTAEYRQGVVLDLLELLRSQAAAVVAGSELERYLDLALGDEQIEGRLLRADSRGQAFDYAFPHTFADPFSGVTATARLRRLDAGSANPILSFSLLLALAGAVGLFALWRMSSVVVEFAERRGNFVAAVTHELKTPLTALRMYSEMLRDGIVPSEERRAEYYATMAAESERLTRLVQNVLDLSRIERAKKGPPDGSVGELRPVLDELLRVVGPHLRERGFALSIDVEPGLPPVRFDRDALLQVLINLVDNALKFARDAETKEITVSVRRDAESVSLAVRDRGPGVPRAHLRRIWEPFWRGERELTRKTKGTGIGLALVRGLVVRMGGAVTARNHPEGGFEVALQLATR